MKVMAEEEPELAEVQFLRVEAEERSDISMEFQVAAVPTFLFFRAGTASKLNLVFATLIKEYLINMVIFIGKMTNLCMKS